MILTGVRSVTIHDPTPASVSDLSAQVCLLSRFVIYGFQYYITDHDFGKPKDQVSLPKLAELNPYVKVSVHTGAITEDLVKQFKVVVCADQSLDDQFRINDICRKQNVSFISAETRGVFSNVFCDFGKEFTVNDLNGEQPQSLLIAHISQV